MSKVPNSRRHPSYRRHKPSGQAVVTLSGRDFYLGRYNSKRSHDEYDRLIAEWLAGGRSLANSDSDAGVSTGELVLASSAHTLSRISRSLAYFESGPVQCRRWLGETACCCFHTASPGISLGIMSESSTALSSEACAGEIFFRTLPAESSPPAVLAGFRQNRAAAGSTHDWPPLRPAAGRQQTGRFSHRNRLSFTRVGSSRSAGKANDLPGGLIAPAATV